jgi:RNA polymerase sigma-70 factor (TIGR02960 family)
VTDAVLARARAGDEHAFRELTEPHRRELHVHCYRLLGSVQDAEDVLQETLLAAWRGLAAFEGRAGVRAWLYRIATNRCLNALRDARRRPAPVPPFQPPEPTRYGEHTWLEPYPGDVPDTAPGPEERHQARETIELAFIAGLMDLPPRQRAALVLKDVLGYPTAEVAAMLDTTETAVKAALQRARSTRPVRNRPDEATERDLARRFATAFEADDIEGVLRLLTSDAWLTMPPAPHEYQGAEAIAAFLGTSAAWHGDRRFHLVPTRANTQPAFGCYLGGDAAGLIVLTMTGDRISAITRFLDSAALGYFGLPKYLPPGGRM